MKQTFRLFPDSQCINRPLTLTYEQFKSGTIYGEVAGENIIEVFEKIRSRCVSRDDVPISRRLPATANAYLIDENGQKIIVDSEKLEFNGFFILEVYREDNPSLEKPEFLLEKREALCLDPEVLGLWRGPVPSSFFILYLTDTKTNNERRKMFKQLYTDLWDKYDLKAYYKGYDTLRRIPFCYCPDAHFNDEAKVVKGRWPFDVTFERIQGYLMPKIVIPEERAITI